MTQDYPKPLAPPLELVSKWCYEDGEEIKSSPRWFVSVCAKAAQWGADQELEECVAFVKFHEGESLARDLRKTRRPKPLSLKEQALAALEHLDDATASQMDTTEAVQIIGLALEQLDD
jgi:hypothetical protein